MLISFEDGRNYVTLGECECDQPVYARSDDDDEQLMIVRPIPQPVPDNYELPDLEGYAHRPDVVELILQQHYNVLSKKNAA